MGNEGSSLKGRNQTWVEGTGAEAPGIRIACGTNPRIWIIGDIGICHHDHARDPLCSIQAEPCSARNVSAGHVDAWGVSSGSGISARAEHRRSGDPGLWVSNKEQWADRRVMTANTRVRPLIFSTNMA